MESMAPPPPTRSAHTDRGPTDRGATALSGALAQIGDRWSLLIVEALMEGAKRFADLETAVAGISTNILTSRLRHLGAAGVVLAVPYSERPRRFAYELTAAGQDLAGAVRLLSQWSSDHSGPVIGRRPEEVAGIGSGATGGAPVHELCGSPMMAVWWCPTCEQTGGAEAPEVVWV
jgi:DNA-binding HxlR family transcriptional regulator